MLVLWWLLASRTGALAVQGFPITVSLESTSLADAIKVQFDCALGDE